MILRLTYIVLFCGVFFGNSRVQAQGAASIDFDTYAHEDTVCVTVNTNGQVRKIGLRLSEAINPDFGTIGSRQVRRVSGFEVQLNLPDGLAIVGMEFPVPGTNAGSGENLLISYAVPLTVYADQTLILGEVWVAIATDGELAANCAGTEDFMFLSPANGATAVGEIAFFDADDPTDPIVLASSTRSLAISGYTFVSEVRQGWGSLKALYR